MDVDKGSLFQKNRFQPSLYALSVLKHFAGRIPIGIEIEKGQVYLVRGSKLKTPLKVQSGPTPFSGGLPKAEGFKGFRIPGQEV